MESFVVRRTLFLAVLAALSLSTALPAEDTIEARTRTLEEKVRQLEEQIRLQNARIEGGGGAQEGAEALPISGIEGGKPFLQSRDGKYKIEFGARWQIRYTYQGWDHRGGTGNDEDRSFLELERLRFGIQGHFLSPEIRYVLEADGHSDESVLELTDAYLAYKPDLDDYQFTFGVGQWKPYFGRQEQTSNSRQLLVDRSLANEYFNIDRNIGIWVEGRKEFAKEGFFNAIAYQFAVTDGIDSVNVSPGDNEFDDIPAFVAHIDLDLIGNLGKDALSSGDLNRRQDPGLTIGASFVSDQNNNSGGVGGNLEFRVYQMGYDFVFKWMGFNLNGEYFGRWLDLQDSGLYNSAFYSHGGLLEAGYLIPETDLQFVARTSAVWNQEGPSHGNAVEVGGGINYFIAKHNMKVSADVIYIDVPGNMPPATEKLPGHPQQDPTTPGFDPITPGDFASFSSTSANLAEFQGVMLRLQWQLVF